MPCVLCRELPLAGVFQSVDPSQPVISPCRLSSAVCASAISCRRASVPPPDCRMESVSAPAGVRHRHGPALKQAYDTSNQAIVGRRAGFVAVSNDDNLSAFREFQVPEGAMPGRAYGRCRLARLSASSRALDNERRTGLWTTQQEAGARRFFQTEPAPRRLRPGSSVRRDRGRSAGHQQRDRAREVANQRALAVSSFCHEANDRRIRRSDAALRR